MNPEISAYIDAIDPKYKAAYIRLLNEMIDQMPEGFKLKMQYDMPSFVVPKSRYPKGYHVNTTLALPFISLGVQKHHIGLYHMGIYANPELLAWFKDQYANAVPTKLDMGKSCIRLKNPANIPYELISQLITQMSVQDWIDRYEKSTSSK